MQVPVDCFLVRRDGVLKMDESSVTGESDMIEKCLLSDVNEGKSGTDEAEPNDR